MVIGTFALFWKHIETIRFFVFFSSSQVGTLLGWNWTLHSLEYRKSFVVVVSLLICVFIFFMCFFPSRLCKRIIPIHINCHNNTKDIKKKPPHLLSFGKCEKGSYQRESSHHASGSMVHATSLTFGWRNIRFHVLILKQSSQVYDTRMAFRWHSGPFRRMWVKRVCQRGCFSSLNDSSRVVARVIALSYTL